MNFKINFHLQYWMTFLVSKQKFSAAYGISTISLRRPQTWQDLPQVIQNWDSLNLCKSNVKRYGTLTFHCKLSKSLFLEWVILINHVIMKSCCLQSNEILSFRVDFT